MVKTSLIQRARDIVADAYLKQQENREWAEPFSSQEHFDRHKATYAHFMRGGSYDKDLAVQATLIALREARKAGAA